MFLAIGVILGLLREFLVVQYYFCITRKLAILGSALTLAIGLLDLGVIARIVWDRDILMAVGYTFGESIGTLVGVKWRGVK